ncbi:unnamed protein product, partial [marine sediment metagenome]
ETKQGYNIGWKEYKGDVLDTGTYKWRIEGNKNPDDSIDWIASVGFGIGELREWAWWNSDWDYRAPIHISNTDAYHENEPINVTIDLDALVTASKLESDFSDLRVLCNGIEKQFNISNANQMVTFFTDSNDSVNTTCYFYYDNDAGGLPTADTLNIIWDDFSSDQADVLWTYSNIDCPEFSYSPNGYAYWICDSTHQAMFWSVNNITGEDKTLTYKFNWTAGGGGIYQVVSGLDSESQGSVSPEGKAWSRTSLLRSASYYNLDRIEFPGGSVNDSIDMDLAPLLWH